MGRMPLEREVVYVGFWYDKMLDDQVCNCLIFPTNDSISLKQAVQKP